MPLQTKHIGQTLAVSGDKTVIKCKSCGYAHVHPLPTQAELDAFYLKNFYQEVKTSYFADYERDQDWWVLNYNWLLDDMAALSGKQSLKGLKLLDIGSGPGLFLKAAADIGLDVLGVEPSKEAFEYSKKKHKVNVENVTVENLDPKTGKFDIIHASLVLEHILDPLKFISKSAKLLKKGGLLCIVVPNDFNPVQEINVKMGKNQYWVSPFEHLNYFNRKSLSDLFKKAAMEVVHDTVTFPIDLFLLMDRNYLEQPELGKECHFMRKSFEFNLESTRSDNFRKKLYSAFAKIGVGRELVMIAKKKEI
jgi:2-polyprenyl-3-methyl-5-hydroxy-6-metoxy-1,4-benzoquinol methylase